MNNGPAWRLDMYLLAVTFPLAPFFLCVLINIVRSVIIVLIARHFAPHSFSSLLPHRKVWLCRVFTTRVMRTVTFWGVHNPDSFWARNEQLAFLAPLSNRKEFRAAGNSQQWGWSVSRMTSSFADCYSVLSLAEEWKDGDVLLLVGLTF